MYVQNLGFPQPLMSSEYCFCWRFSYVFMYIGYEIVHVRSFVKFRSLVWYGALQVRRLGMKMVNLGSGACTSIIARKQGRA